MHEYDYDVALSFAGEDRELAEVLAELLENDGYKVFYDKYEVAQLWGENLYDNFSEIYKNRSRYCVMFVSKHYAQKPWANHERQNAQARAFENSVAYILPIRLDDTEIPGILPTVGYLDLREMSIHQIYQVLEQKLSGEPSQATSTSVTSPVVEDVPGEFVLLRSEDGKPYFVPLQGVRRDSEEMSLEVLPEYPENIAFLRTLQDSLSKGFASRTILTCAYRGDAAWVMPQSIVETNFNWEINLKIHNNRSNYGLFGNTNEEIAESRARRILLNENWDSPNSLSTHNTGFDQLVSEMQIRGMESSAHEPSIQVVESPIPLLYKQFKQTPEKFKKFAHLISILYLKLSNTVENILQLDFELLSSEQLQVKFKGRRPKVYSNVEPSTLEFEGICPLSE